MCMLRVGYFCYNSLLISYLHTFVHDVCFLLCKIVVFFVFCKYNFIVIAVDTYNVRYGSLLFGGKPALAVAVEIVSAAVP